MDELCQLYDETGNPLADGGAGRDDIFSKGLLHGAAHIWVWRGSLKGTEVLVQKRSSTKNTWPNRLHNSAGGHIDYGEQPLTAAVRETREEIGLELTQDDLNFICRSRVYMTTDDGLIDNEFVWVYAMKMQDILQATLQKTEVDSLLWVPVEDVLRDCSTDCYVPFGRRYYTKVMTAISALASNNK